MKNVLDNIKHIGIISRWFRVKEYSTDELEYFVGRVKILFPEYRNDSHLMEKINTILTMQ